MGALTFTRTHFECSLLVFLLWLTERKDCSVVLEASQLLDDVLKTARELEFGEFLRSR